MQDHLKNARHSLILLIILTPLLVWLTGKILPPQPYSVMRYDSFWAGKMDNKDSFDAVLVGDSRVYRGIDPEVIQQTANIRCFNFGFSSAGLEPGLLRHATGLLDPKGKKILLIGVTPAAFSDESLKNEHYHSLEKISKKDIYIRKNIYPFLSDFNYYSLADLKKIYHGEFYYQTFHKNGFVYSNKVPADSLTALWAYEQFLRESKINRQAIGVFLRMISELREQNITCYAFRIPVAAPLRKLEDTLFDFTSFESEFTAAGGYWIDLPATGFRSYDGSHLDGPSAVKLSHILADSIKLVEKR